MAPGAHVFRANRVGLWVIPNSGLTDKLRHVLPRARGPIPNLTDIYLPPEAVLADAKLCRDNGYFVSTYDVVHDRAPGVVAAAMLANRAELKSGAIEIDLEGAAVSPDLPAMATWATAFVKAVRKTNPNLPIRLNVPPTKGFALPISLINSDPQLFVIAQAYFGNQDGRMAEDQILLDLLDWGVPRDKAKIMYAVLNDNPQNQRVYSLPHPGFKPITEGSVFSDDLLLDAGVL